jgi:hypothetical protein
MTDSHDGPVDDTVDITDFDDELDLLLSGSAPSAEAPAWCGDVALLVRTAQAPARADELAREAEIVAQMRELRLAVLAEAEAAAAEGRPAPADADPDPADPPTLTVVATDDGPEVEAEATGEPDEGDAYRDDEGDDDGAGRPGAYRDAGPAVIDLRVKQAQAELVAYRAKHAGERYYRAKHAAARLEASQYPLVRTVGRVVAIKAVAITTAVGIAAAAAAATTGIVATVVVPTLTQPEHHVTVASPAPATRGPEVGTTATRHARSGKGGAAAKRSECASVLPACVPLPAALVPTVAPEVAKQAAVLTAGSAATPASTTPAAVSPSTTVAETPATTTPPTTAAPEPPPTTAPEPPPTTEPPTTAPPVTDPGVTGFSTSSSGP